MNVKCVELACSVCGREDSKEADVMDTLKWWVHNLVAHPLLILCPPLGEWLHDRTIYDA